MKKAVIVGKQGCARENGIWAQAAVTPRLKTILRDFPAFWWIQKGLRYLSAGETKQL